MHKQVIEKLKALIKDDSSIEFTEEIIGLTKDIEKLEKDHTDVIEISESYRKKYIESIKSTGFPKTQEETQEESKDLESILLEIMK